VIIIRLKKSRDFNYVKNKGLAFVRPSFVLQKAPSRLNLPLNTGRVGFTASRKVGGAVDRNRAKRIMRHLVHECQNDLTPGFDYVMVARERLLTQPFKDMKADLVRALLYLTKHKETTPQKPSLSGE